MQACGACDRGSIPLGDTTQEIASGFGSPRGVYPDAGGTRRLIGIQFWGQKRIGGFAKEKKNF